MQWIEGVISLEDAPEQLDGLMALMAELGVSISIEDSRDFWDFLAQNRQYWDYVDAELEQHFQNISRIHFYVSDDGEGRELIRTIEHRTHRPVQIRKIQDQDWENSWREFYAPIPIGTKLLIVPHWLDPPLDGRRPVRLEPGLTFGTGNHPTTQMCLAAMEHLDLDGCKALDLGCGSGILGLAALALGCEQVTGVDVDPLAAKAVAENAGYNGMTERFSVQIGDFLRDQKLRARLGEEFHLVLANIVADVILQAIPIFPKLLRPAGNVICSGILAGREGEIETALRKGGFQIAEHLQQEEWHCYRCTFDPTESTE